MLASIFAVLGLLALCVGAWPATIFCWIIALLLDSSDEKKKGVPD